MNDFKIISKEQEVEILPSGETGQPTFNPDLEKDHSINLPRLIVQWVIGKKHLPYLHTYLLLKYFAADGKGLCVPDLQVLADLKGCSLQTIYNHLNRLLKLGWIHRGESKDAYYIRAWIRIQEAVECDLRQDNFLHIDNLEVKPERSPYGTRQLYTFKLPTEVLSDYSFFRNLLLYMFIFVCCRNQFYNEKRNKKRRNQNFTRIQPYLISCSLVGNWFGFSKMSGSKIRKLLVDAGFIRMRQVADVTNMDQETASYLREEMEHENLRFNDLYGAIVFQHCSKIFPLEFSWPRTRTRSY